MPRLPRQSVMIGPMKVMVRRIVTEVVRYLETSLVSHGADAFAQKIGYLKLIVPKGYHAETINFRTPTLETASFKNGSIYNYLPPQYVRMVVSGK